VTGLAGYALGRWPEVERRFLLMGIPDPLKLPSGRFWRLLWADLIADRDTDSRVRIDAVLRGVTPPVPAGSAPAPGRPAGTAEERTRARIAEMHRRRAQAAQAGR
jgi:hypothetical protein